MSSNSLPALPEGWQVHHTENGTPYYHHETKGTQWERPTEPSKVPSGIGKIFSKFDDSAEIQGDDLVASISSFFTTPANQSLKTIEGNLRGGESTGVGFLSATLSLGKYFQITGDEFKIRCLSVYTMMQGISQSPNGVSQNQASMFSEKPDLFSTLWITLAGAILLGFLPNIIELVANGRPAQFKDYTSALFTFSLYPLAAIAAYIIGVVQHRQQSNMLSKEESYVQLPTALCIMGYAQVPIVAALPILMINSWIFRMLVVTICFVISISYLIVILRGSCETVFNMPSPKRTQLIVIGAVMLLPHLTIMMKLPSPAYTVENKSDAGYGNLTLNVDEIMQNKAAMEELAEAMSRISKSTQSETTTLEIENDDIANLVAEVLKEANVDLEDEED